MPISSSYASILGETNFQPQELPRSGSKAKDGKEREREREKERQRKKVKRKRGKESKNERRMGEGKEKL